MPRVKQVSDWFGAHPMFADSVWAGLIGIASLVATANLNSRWVHISPVPTLEVLSIVWAGALGGIALSVFKPEAPRWLYTPLYVALGWVACWFLPDFWQTGGPAVVWLLIAGGLSYTVGALCYGLRWPNPWPKVWGFHEFFHTGTLFGYACHAVAVWLAVLSLA